MYFCETNCRNGYILSSMFLLLFLLKFLAPQVILDTIDNSCYVWLLTAKFTSKFYDIALFGDCWRTLILFLSIFAMFDFWLQIDLYFLCNALFGDCQRTFLFLAVQNSSIGDLVPCLVGSSVYNYKQSESSQHYRVTLETCELWDIWSE